MTDSRVVCVHCQYRRDTNFIQNPVPARRIHARGLWWNSEDVTNFPNSWYSSRKIFECESCGFRVTGQHYVVMYEGATIIPHYYCEDCYYAELENWERCAETRPENTGRVLHHDIRSLKQRHIKSAATYTASEK